MSDTVMNVLVFGGVALGLVLLFVVYRSIRRDPVDRARRRGDDQASIDNWRNLS